MIRTMYQVDSFSDHVFGGNPAAVLVLDEWLPERMMQAIAAENNLAETAFVKPAGPSWDLRWFTPTVEVDFCGHATLAAAHILIQEYGAPSPLAFSTRVGPINVDRHKQGYLLDLPCIRPEQASTLPPMIEPLFRETLRSHFRNFENIFVELADEAAVRSFTPDLHAMAQLGPVGVVITAKGEEDDFVSRYFAPGAGIPEDPVTGSIHATLVPFWAERLGKSTLTAFQASPRGGRLVCELKAERVLIQGQAVTYMKAEVYLPDFGTPST